MPLREMYEGWPFFRKLVDFMQMTLAKSDLRIAENYTSLVSDPAIRERLWQRISGEHASCVEALLRVTGNENLLKRFAERLRLLQTAATCFGHQLSVKPS
ncbi:MAG: phosphoenolpyruvate carboxylase [Actinomycetota bacterium]|nr:phosphoenolpyruvate carboxylase [Actinomycetota bacterium]